MKANELMIGDWVMINLISYYQVEQIRVEFDEPRIYLKGTEVFATENEIMSVPLTPEILEKNGFKLFNSNEYRKEYVWFKNGERSQNYISVVFYGDGGVLVIMEEESISIDGVNRVHICDILYVHQLQHALRLCGIKIEIEL